MSKIELLAPAGSYEALVAAVENGADAIYLGGNEFSARAFATNFNRDELKQAVAYSHLRNVKIYVTINTLYEDNQFKQLHDYLLFLLNINVDALIIQDMGLINYIQTYFPEFEIHLSTQTSIRNLAGVQYFENRKISRVVLARENTLEEIKKICQHTDLEIEVFVHGALCMSYSGQCLMSSMIAKRSGNKGACGQPCRLAYQLEKDDQILNEKPAYLLSPKDLCTIEHIGDLIEAGVTSFKIEGRMKRPEYVAVVVKNYRQAIDEYLSKYTISNQDQSILEMKKIFNRGFTNGYIFNDQNFMAKDFPGNRGLEVGKVVSYDQKRKRIKIKLAATLKQGDRIFFPSIELTRTITKLYFKGKLVNQAGNGDLVEIELKSPIKSDEKIYKVIDSDLINQAQNSYQNSHVKNNIAITFNGQINQNPTLTVTCRDVEVTVTSNQPVVKANNQPLDKERIRQQLTKLGNTPFTSNSVTINFSDNAFFSIKELNSMRREAVQQLEIELTKNQNYTRPLPDKPAYHLSKTIKGIDVRVYNLEQLESLIAEDIHRFYFPLNHQFKQAYMLAKQYHKHLVPFTGFLTENRDLIKFKHSDLYPEIDQILVGDFGALNTFANKQCLLDFNFNLYNSYAFDYFKNHSCVLSLEMSKKMINDLKNVQQELILTVYGKSINMHLKHCIISDYYFNCQKDHCNLCHHGNYSLVDRKGEHFTILTDDNCNNLLFNSHYLYLENISDVDCDYVLLSFSDESGQQCLKVFNDYKNNILQNKTRKNIIKDKITNGYFND